MAYQLVSTDGSQTFELHAGPRMIVGRASGSEIEVLHPTVSRQHAELQCYDTGVHVRDLNSRNGTFVNGARVESAEVVPGATIAFGSVGFRVEALAPTPDPIAEAAPVHASPPEPTPTPVTSTSNIVRERAVRRESGAKKDSASAPRDVSAGAPSDPRELNERKLALLLEASKGLARTADIAVLLERIADFVFQILDADRVAILLRDEQGDLVPKIARDRDGTRAERAVPRSIARKVMEEQVAVLTDNAREDARFGGQSVLQQRVRSAMCAPLVGSEPATHGVLYVDNVTAAHRFTDDDLDLLIAFSGIAAVAIENSQFSATLRREALVRSNFERHFSPNLAARIASAPDAVKLGGEKRQVAILFSDIRGFTALSEAMKPEDVARLLSDYFTAMVECVFRHGGTLDKFIGDAILAQWGAPLGAIDDADRAVAAATDMVRALDALNAQWTAEGRPMLHVGIGLNAGEVFAGYVGSEQRLEYTVIGDPVNVAARVCKAAGGGEILLTGDIRALLASPPPLRERAALELKGKSQSVAVYSVEL